MRLKRRIQMLLVERNVLNVDEIDSFVAMTINGKDMSTQEAKWLETAFRKWLINQAETEAEIRRPRGMHPAWVHDAVERGEQVFVVALPAALVNQAHHVIDWARQARVRSLNRVSWPDALKATKKWDKQLKNQSAEGRDFVKKIDDLGDGYSLVKLLDSDACKREGALMKHCVGGYNPNIYGSHGGLYSVRDRKGMPHATIEIVRGKVAQLYGKANSPVGPKHRKHVMRAIRSKELGVKHVDATMLGNLAAVMTRDGAKGIDELKAGDAVVGSAFISNKAYDAICDDLPPNITYDSVTFDGIKRITLDKASIGSLLDVRNAGVVSLSGSSATEAILSNGAILEIKRSTINDEMSQRFESVTATGSSFVSFGCGNSKTLKVDGCVIDKSVSVWETQTATLINVGCPNVKAEGVGDLTIDRLDGGDVLTAHECHNVDITNSQADLLTIRGCASLSATGTCRNGSVYWCKKVKAVPSCAELFTISDSKLADEVECGKIKQLTITGCHGKAKLTSGDIEKLRVVNGSTVEIGPKCNVKELIEE